MEAAKKIIVSGKYDTTDALKGLAVICENYYQPGEMMKILLDNGADFQILSDTWVGKCLYHMGKRLMLNNFQQAKFMAEIFRKHNPSDITTFINTRPYDEWGKYFGGSLSCHMLSHLWELIESGTGYGGKVNYSTWLGYTPLMYASIFNKAEIVKFLIKNGADINARNTHNQNAVVLAVM